MTANKAADGKAKMSDEEVLGQLRVLQLAGHESTSSSLSWCLFHLMQQSTLQCKLRVEIREAKAALAPGENLSGEQLSALPYCDAVVVSILLTYKLVPSFFACLLLMSGTFAGASARPCGCHLLSPTPTERLSQII